MPKSTPPTPLPPTDLPPSQLISETTNQFHIAPDKDSLTRISSSLSALGSNRSSRLAAQQNALKSLSRRLNNLHAQHEYEENRHDAGKHASEILSLDAEKFRVAKSAYDVEVEGERLEGELAGLKAQLDTLEREGVEGGRRRGEDEGDEVLYVLLLVLSYSFEMMCWRYDMLTTCVLGSNFRCIARWGSTCRKTATRAFSTAQSSEIRQRVMLMW